MTRVFLHSPRAIRQHLLRDIEPDGFLGTGVRIVLCDDHNQVLCHCHVADIPPDLSPSECRRTLTPFARGIAQGGDGAILVALTRPGPPVLTPADLRWYRAARRTCEAHAVRLLGVHVVTPRGQREVVLDDAM